MADARSQTPIPSVSTGEGSSAAGERLDRATLERVRRRDPQALETFFDVYFDRVYGLIRRLVGDATLAEDVTQEVFLKAHRALDRLDPERDPVPWLMTIAHNACRDLWRSGAYRLSRRSASIDENPGLDREIPAAGTPEKEALARERNATGHIHFSMIALMENRQGIADRLKAGSRVKAYIQKAHAFALPDECRPL